MNKFFRKLTGDAIALLMWLAVGCLLFCAIHAPAQIPLSSPPYYASTTQPTLGTTAVAFTSDANCTVSTATNCTVSNGNAGPWLYELLVTGSISTTRNLVVPNGRIYTVINKTTGGQSIQVIGTSGTGVTIANGATATVAFDGTNYVATGGLPAGPSGAIQYNAAGILGGTSNATLNSGGDMSIAGLTLAGGSQMTGNQGTGALIQHALGSTVNSDLVAYNLNGDTVDSNIVAANVILSRPTGQQQITAFPLSVNLSGQTVPTLPSNTDFSVFGVSGLSARALVGSYGGTAYHSSVTYGGTASSPTAVTSGTELGGFNACAYNGTGLNCPIGSFRIYANQNQTTGAAGTYADIAVTPNGSTSEAEVIKFGNDGSIITPGQTPEGPGTINVAGCYIAGVACGTGSSGANSTSIQAAPYYSGGALTDFNTTTSGSTSSGSSSLTVASIIDFTASASGVRYGHEGIYVAAGGGTPVTTTITTTLNSTAFTAGSCSGVTQGMGITATGVPGRSRVVSCSGTSGVMTRFATASGTNSVTFAVPYIGTVSTATGTTIGLAGTTSGTIPSGAYVGHDESASFQAWATATAYGASNNVSCPDGIYHIDWAFQNTSTANAMVVFPALNYYSNPLVSPAQASIAGNSNPAIAPTAACIIETDNSSSTTSGGGFIGAIFGSYATDSGSPWGNQSNIHFFRRNVAVRSYNNPAVIAFNSYYFADDEHWNVTGDIGLAPNCLYDPGICPVGPTNPPTNTGAIFLVTPQTDFLGAGNSYYDTYITGWYTGVQAQEHVNFVNLWVSAAFNCVVMNNGTGHAAYFEHPHCEHTTREFSGSSDAFEVTDLSSEPNFTGGSTTIIYDPSNTLNTTHFTYEDYLTGTSGFVTSTPKNGGQNVNLCNLGTQICLGQIKQENSVSVTVPTMIVENLSSATGSGYSNMAYFGVPTQNTGTFSSIGFGREQCLSSTQEYDTATLAFSFAGVNSTSNYGLLGTCFGTDAIHWFPNGNVTLPTGSLAISAGNATITQTNGNCASGVCSPLTVTSNGTNSTNILLSDTSSDGHQFNLGSTGSGNDPGWMTLYDNTEGLGLLAATASSSTVGYVQASDDVVLGWSSNALPWNAAADTGLSRDSAGVVDCGNGTLNNKACTFNAGALNVTGVAALGSSSTVNGSLICTAAGVSGCATGTGTVTTSGSPATNTIPKFTGSTSIGNSTLTDNGTSVSTSEPLQALSVSLGSAMNSNTLSIVNNNSGTATEISSGSTTGAEAQGAIVFVGVDSAGSNSLTYLTLNNGLAGFTQGVSAPSVTDTTVLNALCIGTNGAGLNQLGSACNNHQLYGNIQGTLFTTGTMLGPVFYEKVSGSLNLLMARLSGTISCTGTPSIQLIDLSTSPTTAYLSGTVVATLVTGTSDGVYTSGTGLGNATFAGHYYGFAFSVGTCVTAPTFDITAQIQ